MKGLTNRVVLLFAFAAFAGVRAEAQNVVRTITSEIKGSNVGLFGGAAATTGTPVLIGPKWTVPNTRAGYIGDLKIPAVEVGPIKTPAINLGRTGAAIDFSGSGEVGIRVTPWFTGGTMNFNWQNVVSITFPRFPRVGESVTARATVGTGGGSYFSTTSPEFGASFDAVGRVAGSARTEGWFLGEQKWGANLFTPFSRTPPDKSITGLVKFKIPEEVNFLLGKLNPAPVGAQIFMPVIESYSGSVQPDRSLTGKAFDAFLSVETDALSWISMLLTGTKQTLMELASGDYMVPGTSFRAQWDIAKLYANMDLGFVGSYKLQPTTSVQLEVLNSSNQRIAIANDQVTFAMPAEGVKIRPTLTTTLELTSRLDLGITGAIGMNPFMVAGRGKWGAGPREQSIDFVMGPAKVEWKGPDSTTAKVREIRSPVSLAEADRVRSLSPVPINVANPTELPPYIYGGANGQEAVELQAYATDADKEYRTFGITPEQGYRFFIGASTVLRATLSGPSGSNPVDLSRGNIDDLRLQFQVPGSLMKPGEMMLTLSVGTRNASGQPRSRVWTIPMRFLPQTPVLDGEFFRRADRQPNSSTNRIAANGQDQWIYCGVRHLYTDTKAVINGAYVVPTNATSESAITGQSVIGIKIPADLAGRLAGQTIDVQLRNSTTRTDATGKPQPPLLSAAKKLFVAAKPPVLSAYEYADQPNGPVPYGAAPVSLQITGANFTPNSSVVLSYTVPPPPGTIELPRIPNPFGGRPPSSPSPARSTIGLPVVFSSERALRVDIPVEAFDKLHTDRAGTFSLQVRTPATQMAATAADPAEVSGGNSGMLALKLERVRPTLLRINPPVIRPGATSVLELYGSNFAKMLHDDDPSIVTIDGIKVPRTAIGYGPGPNLARLEMHLNLAAFPAPAFTPGRHVIKVSNGPGRDSVEFAIMTEAPQAPPELAAWVGALGLGAGTVLARS